ncbi:MAG: LysR family transcriptional regulator [Deltaproteobacteria bacterium]|nr:LysR family transcriptional regulator [Deltaproteobacteria bacterium]MBK8236699.1 LysR family transcriptional regulator [Deltaproteobacteria bacterium]MBP7288726.1 LysR family transcriptional regulator [Nannocystaceae bacterium]
MNETLPRPGRTRRAHVVRGHAPTAMDVDLEDLRAFIDIAQRGSIQSAARGRGRSRATYVRLLQRLERAFAVEALLERAPGQRQGLLTPQGAELLRRAQQQVRQWDEWRVHTRDALAGRSAALRIGTLPGSFDLIAESLSDLRERHPALELRIGEYDDDALPGAIRAGEVDLGFATLEQGRAPAGLSATVLGELSWAVIAPRAMAARLPAQVSLRDLDGVPLVVLRQGPARERIERSFVEHGGARLRFDPAFEVGATPRVVELVARGFGPAIVSRFRLAFLPRGVVSRPLVDGPPPLRAGVLHRRGAALGAEAEQLLVLARTRFAQLS